MSNATLTVKNFGPINDATLDLRKVTVLIGEQASGKSVLAKLAAIFGDILLEEKDLSRCWRYFKLEEFLSKNSSVGFKNEEFYQDVTKGKWSKTFYTEDLKRRFLHYSETRQKWLSERGGEVVDGFTEESREAFYANRTQMALLKNLLSRVGGEPRYFPAERSLLGVLEKSIFRLLDSRIELPEFLTNFAADYEVAKSQKGPFEVPFLNVAFNVEDGQSRVVLPNQKSVAFSDSATGFQTAIPLALVIESFKKRHEKCIFIIEEPELNLYPSTQKRLVEYLVKQCTEGDNRLILTTHSPYILTALDNCIQANNVLRAHPEAADKVNALVPAESQISFDDVAAYFVAGGGARSIMDEENRLIDGNALDDISDELGETFDKLLDLELQTS